MKYYIYLDDVRTPLPNPSTHETPEWIVVRSYDEFVAKITELGLENIALISLDHDLGDTAMMEWHTNVYRNFTLNYDNITEKTGMDCTKWLVEQWMDGAPVCKVMIHSANAIVLQKFSTILAVPYLAGDAGVPLFGSTALRSVDMNFTLGQSLFLIDH